jgi:hypothetical protein
VVIVGTTVVLAWYFLDPRNHAHVEDSIQQHAQEIALSNATIRTCMKHTVGSFGAHVDAVGNANALDPDFGIHMTVVGNAELSESDRDDISHLPNVVRFNDCPYLRPGEQTKLHVIRDPSSGSPRIDVDAPEWHVATSPDFAPAIATLFTPVYEPTYGDFNMLNESARIFEGCPYCGDNCLQRGTYGGPSTGGIVLSEMQSCGWVGRIHVFGFNWNGDDRMHIDFADPDIVRNCCTKCVFHETMSADYGDSQALKLVFMLVVASTVVIGCAILAVAAFLRHMRQTALPGVTDGAAKDGPTGESGTHADGV